MPRLGKNIGISIDETTAEQLDSIGKVENCRSRSETVRRFIQQSPWNC
jgi:metal-responsive CopG/Arc/MetJ family transcriptional regulator